MKMAWLHFIALLVLNWAWLGAQHTPILSHDNCFSESKMLMENDQWENETIIKCNGTQQYRVSIMNNTYYNLYCKSAANISANLIHPQPSIPVGALKKYFLFRWCPSPSTSYADTMKQIGVTSVTEIKIRNTRPNTTLTRKHLEGLEELEVKNLNLYDNNLKHIDEDAFEAVPNLIQLELSFNEELQLSAGIFQPLKQLRVLRLSKMGLQKLPEHLFNISTLEELFLGRNTLQLTPRTFEGARNLKKLDISSNTLTNLPRNVFKQLTNLRNVDLSYNALVALSGELFQSNKIIEVINLTGNNLTALPENLFYNLESLINLKLSDNKLEYIPEKLLFNSSHLKYLDLSENYLTTLSTATFKSLRLLETLHLHHNRIESLQSEHFAELSAMITLTINFNQLASVAFPPNLKIEYLDASSNQLVDWSGGKSGFSELQKLQILDLHNNFIRHIYSDWQWDLKHLVVLNISHNHIESIDSFAADLDFDKEQVLTVDLSFNRISFIDLVDYQEHITKPRKHGVSVNLTGNSVVCDCHLHPFFLYREITSKSMNGIKFIIENTFCAKPSALIGRSLSTVRDEEIICEEDVNDKCILSFKPSRSARVLDCSNGSLKSPIDWYALPDFITSNGRKIRLKYNHTELVLENNGLTTLEVGGKLPNNVTVLKLRGNQLNLKVGDIPDQIEELDLRNNNLASIKDPVAKMIVGTRPRKLKISNNPLECNCDNNVFLSLLQHHNNTFIVEDYSLIKCSNNQFVLETRLGPLCDTSSTAVVVVSVLAALVVIVTIICCRYKVAIKVYLIRNYPQSRRYLLKYVPVNDSELKNDVFISYSHLNEIDVFKLNQFLEKMNYVTCLHERDWVGGVSILDAIENSVRESQTSIFFVTPEFVQSKWSCHEFRVAFSRQVVEYSSNIIVVVKGNIDAIARKDKNIRNYIKRFTYLKWEDPSFENRLILALPERLSTQANGKKWNNVKLSQVNVSLSKDVR